MSNAAPSQDDCQPAVQPATEPALTAHQEAMRQALADLSEAEAWADKANKELQEAKVGRVESAISAAVQRGAIPALDLALQQRWSEACLRDPEMIELLAQVNGSPALSRHWRSV